MQDTTTTLPDGDPVKDNSTPWSTHPGYDLSLNTLLYKDINNRDRYTPNSINASVEAIKFAGDKAGDVRMSLDAGPASIYADMSAHNARTLARALLDAADVLDAFEQAEKADVEGVPV